MAESVQEEVEVVNTGPPPCPILKELYDSERPAVELLPGVSLSPIVNACWLTRDAKTMLEENWIPVPVDNGLASDAPPPAFDPTAAEYNDMQRRLSKSDSLVRWNNLTIKIKQLEKAVETTKGEEQEANKIALEEAKGQIAEIDAQLLELKASFVEDPLSLVSWMQTLFDLADAGLTTFDVSGHFFPYCGLVKLFSSDNTSSYYDGVEKVLGLFKKRYEKERGPNKIQILTKLVPNIFQDGYNANMVEGIIAKIRKNILGDDSMESIDLVQLYWFDFKEFDVLPTLKALQALTEDKVEYNPDTNTEVVIEPKKVKGIGLLNFPLAAIKDAIRAGVPITSVSIPYTVIDRSNLEILKLCKDYNIKVLVRDGILGGLVNERYIGVPYPNSKVEDPNLESVAYSLDLVAKAGGWEKFQTALKTIKSVADKHGVTMQTVALRWQIDQGTFPVVTMRWAPDCWKQFGHKYIEDLRKPGLDAALFQKASFFHTDDVAKLMSLWQPL